MIEKEEILLKRCEEIEEKKKKHRENKIRLTNLTYENEHEKIDSY